MAVIPTGAALVALTAGGLALARRLQPGLPGATVHGLARRVDGADIAFDETLPHLRTLFATGTPIVGICASGVLIRALGSLLADKVREPPVVAVAEDGSVAVPLLGGHRGANVLARTIAELTGGVAAVTTAGDLTLGFALDEPPAGWRIGNPDQLTAFAAALLAGTKVRLIVEAGDAGWLRELPVAEDSTLCIRVTDRAVAAAADELIFHPPTLALGVGCERDVPPAELDALVRTTLAAHNLSPRSVALVASLALKQDEPAVLMLAESLGAPARFFDADRLEQETPRLPNPSETVFRAVGCHGVAEAAALAAAGADGELIVPKARGTRVTCAIARAVHVDPAVTGRRRGAVTVVGLGPGASAWRTPAASAALATASDHVGYTGYLDLLGAPPAGVTRHGYTLGQEIERVAKALDLAGDGSDVALISSGDPGVYALASLVFEMLDQAGDDHSRGVAVTVEPGVSAMHAAAARAGAPLGHDFCAISLSDLMTPWPVIERRLRAAAEADFVTALYNPRSRRRTEALQRSCAILAEHRPPSTPVVVARQVGRDGEDVAITTLAELDVAGIDMLTLVIVGSSQSRQFRHGGRQWMYTPRGYAVAET